MARRTDSLRSCGARCETDEWPSWWLWLCSSRPGCSGGCGTPRPHLGLESHDLRDAAEDPIRRPYVPAQHRRHHGPRWCRRCRPDARWGCDPVRSMAGAPHARRHLGSRRGEDGHLRAVRRAPAFSAPRSRLRHCAQTRQVTLPRPATVSGGPHFGANPSCGRYREGEEGPSALDLSCGRYGAGSGPQNDHNSGSTPTRTRDPSDSDHNPG